MDFQEIVDLRMGVRKVLSEWRKAREEGRGGQGVIYATQRPYYPLYTAVGQEGCTLAESRDKPLRQTSRAERKNGNWGAEQHGGSGRKMAMRILG